MSVEAMKQMVEAIDADLKLFNIPATAKMLEALNAGRQAIAEAEKQEPVGVVGMDVSRPHISYGGQYLGQKQDTKTAILFKDLEVGTNLYTHPSKREWVVLTDEEIDQGLLRTPYAMKTAEAWRDGVRWAYHQLKEKNT